MPSPNLIASVLARLTERVRIAVVGNALPLYDPPTRVAEEFAMIDCISGGRLIAGMVVGGGPEYYSFSLNPAHARQRFAEAHDLILKVWTEPGPFEFTGKHYKLRYVNSWPRPIQQPHPEIWIPGVGSLETLEFVAKHRYAYMGIPYFHISVFERMFAMMRDACEREGYVADPLQLGWLVPIFVAETDAEARRRYEEHFWYFVRRLLPGINISPPGYTSVRSVENIMKNAGTFALNLETWEQVVEGQYAIVGSPADGHRAARRQRRAPGGGQPARPLPAGHAPGRRHPEEPGAVRHRGHAGLAGRLPGHAAAGGTRVGRGGGAVMTALSAGTLDTAVGPIEVHRAGAGGPAPVLYLHSAQGEGPGMAMLEELADTRQVVAPLFPGFGASEGLALIDDIEDAAFHLLDVLDRLGFAACDMVGSSLRRMDGRGAAVRWPERVRRMVLVNAVGLYVEGAPITEIFGRAPSALAADLFADRDFPLAQLMRAMDAMEADPSQIPFEFVRPVLQAQAATAKVGWNPYLHDPKLRGRLGRITAPTLVVHARQDGIVPRAHAQAYASAIPGAVVVELDDAAHLAVLERPVELAEARPRTPRGLTRQVTTPKARWRDGERRQRADTVLRHGPPSSSMDRTAGRGKLIGHARLDPQGADAPGDRAADRIGLERLGELEGRAQARRALTLRRHRRGAATGAALAGALRRRRGASRRHPPVRLPAPRPPHDPARQAPRPRAPAQHRASG